MWHCDYFIAWKMKDWELVLFIIIYSSNINEKRKKKQKRMQYSTKSYYLTTYKCLLKNYLYFIKNTLTLS
jgi:hypothetical protein